MCVNTGACLSVADCHYALILLSEVVGSLHVYLFVSACMGVCICVHVLWGYMVLYTVCSAGKLDISSKRFQAWSAMKTQLRDESAAPAPTDN